MNAASVVDALRIPAAARVDQRIPKKLIAEHGGASAADRRRIQEGIEALLWIAALKPSAIGIPEFRDEVRDYVEVEVVHLAARSPTDAARLNECVHRSMPYPVMLVTETEGRVALSAAHKRRAQNEPGRVIIDGDMHEVWFEAGSTSAADALARVVAAIRIDRLPAQDLQAFYGGYADALVAARIARVTQAFTLSRSAAHTDERLLALSECERLEREIQRLTSAAAKERQMARRVETNLAVQRLRAELTVVRSKL